MVIPSQPRKASWLSDLLRHRTAKEAPLEFISCHTKTSVKPLCTTLHISTVASRRSAYTAK